jgi:small subunit ribosomal protein S3
MGQKIHPIGFRIGITRDWTSKWFADKKTFSKYLLEDYKIRTYLQKKFEPAGLKAVDIERSANEINITIKVAKPGMVIGRGGTGVEEVEKEVKKLTKSKIRLTAEEVKTPEIEAQLVADYIARQLKRRMPFKRVANSAINSAMDKGAKGIKIRFSGLLSGGNSIGRTEIIKKGSVPAQTLRADVDYAQVHCLMLYGMIGIKVWIYRGEFS